MVSLNNLTYDLLNLTRGGKLSTGELISLRQVQFWVHNTRALLIRQDLKNGSTISQNIVQNLGCVNVQRVDAAACCGIVTECYLYRTTIEIPKPIELHKKDLFTRIGPVSLTEAAFTYMPFNRIQYAGNTPFKKLNERPKAFYFDKYVYIQVKPGTVLKKINIQGVFEDPSEVSTFNNCDGQDCWTENSKYPISAWMIEPLKEMILKNNFRIAVSAGTDDKNDNKGNYVAPVSKDQ